MGQLCVRLDLNKAPEVVPEAAAVVPAAIEAKTSRQQALTNARV
jgi:hypothetical protein